MLGFIRNLDRSWIKCFSFGLYVTLHTSVICLFLFWVYYEIIKHRISPSRTISLSREMTSITICQHGTNIYGSCDLKVVVPLSFMYKRFCSETCPTATRGPPAALQIRLMLTVCYIQKLTSWYFSIGFSHMAVSVANRIYEWLNGWVGDCFKKQPVNPFGQLTDMKATGHLISWLSF